MLSQPPQIKPQILLSGVQQLDELARQFRRKLRDVALQLSQETRDAAPIGPEIILQAVPGACRKLLTDLGSGFGEIRDSDDQKKEAA